MKSNHKGLKKPELLLPVGTKEMCLAAIHNGADAVYMGVPSFNARGRTTDFTIEELKELIELCHLYDVKVLLAFNVLIFEEELDYCLEVLNEIIPLNPDAFIVQDLGLVKLIKEICPEQVVHASTQMTITNAHAIEFLDDLDIKRFVLGREVSLKEIEKVKERTDKEIEVFVHGALCVAYSGQCLTSESLGGRSANRGQCAQSCRFEYDLIVDGEKYNTNNRNYLVSPQDLCGLNEIEKLTQLQVDCLKVEGRLKGPDYVAACASSYRQELDKMTDQKSRAQNFQKIEKSFSRGYFSGWLHGVDHQKLVEGSYGNHRGPLAGIVENITGQTIWLKSNLELNPGMGLIITNPKISTSNFELGANIYETKQKKDQIGITVAKHIDLSKVQKGMRVFINKDPNNTKDLEKSFTDKTLLKRMPVNIEVYAKLDEPLRIVYQDFQGHTAELLGEEVQASQKRPTLKEDIEKELSKLSTTCFYLDKIEFETDENIFISNKELKTLRQQAIKDLYQLRIQRPSKDIRTYNFTELEDIDNNIESKANVLIRNTNQLQSFLNHVQDIETIKYIILDYEFGKDYAADIERVRAKGLSVAIATTRILKPNEYHHLKVLIRLNPDAILVRNLGAINFLRENNYQGDLFGDFSLNVSNSLSYEYLSKKGLSSLCLSYDLNAKQISNLIAHCNPSKLEITIHQYMPEFHMEHCVFAAFLSNGSSFKDCGKPCEEHKVELKDPYGNFHTLAADQECRNTLFKNSPQAAISSLKGWIDNGVSHFRIEGLNESGEELARKYDLYASFINDLIDEDELKDKLNVLEKFGVTEGQLLFNDNYQDRKQF
ncbi:MAG: U32 family peptidase [Oligoflexia bacterium]|nr:U32 family peptidase [Oligoflexia bacterium]